MATTRQYLSGTTTMRQLMSKVADALVSTGKWDKIVDNTPTTGTNPTTGHFVIVSPKQTYQYRTAGGNTTDSGAGASPRYTHNTVTGAERIYFKFNPLFNASNQYLGYTIQQCNQMNAGGTDLYGTSGQIQAGGIYDYKYADGSAANTATWGTTNTWYHRVACTKQCISPTNTNYINHDVVLPYTAFGAQEANVRYWLIVGTDDSPTLANSKDKEDWFVLTVQGLDGTTNTIGSNICGIFKSDFLWHNYYGVARSILCPIINFITTTGAGSSYASVNPLVCFGTVFDNTIFQNPSTLLGQFSHRAADISITNV